MDETLESEPDGSVVCVIVVTFNSAVVIERCLHSIRESGLLARTIVVDNGSADGSADVVERLFPEVMVVRSSSNLGFAAGCNRGMREAKPWKPAYFFFLNPDAVVTEQCVDRLCRDLEDNNRLAVASPLLRDLETGEIRYAGAELDLERMALEVRGWGAQEVALGEGLVLTGRPTGAAMIVRQVAVDAVGMMDEAFFLYWEEAEWAWRFRSHGFDVAVELTAVALHASSHSTGGPGSPVFEYYVARNLLMMVAKARHLGKAACIRAAVGFLARRVVETIAYRSVARTTGTVTWIFVGILDFCRGRSGMRPSLHVPRRMATIVKGD
jgi:GT2 family glycosyltransferase